MSGHRTLTYSETLGETTLQLRDRLGSLAVAVTVTFMFTCLAWLVPTIRHLPLPQALAVYALTVLGSVAIMKRWFVHSCGRSRRAFF